MLGDQTENGEMKSKNYQAKLGKEWHSDAIYDGLALVKQQTRNAKDEQVS